MYLGWARAGSPGAALVGLAFVLPSFAMVVALAVFYIHYGGLPWIQGAFYGLGAAVIALIARSALKLTRLTLGREALHWSLFGVAALVTAWTESEIVWVMVGAGVVAMVARARRLVPGPGTALGFVGLPAALFAGLSGPATSETLLRIAWYFTEAGAFVFGSGLAIVPFLHAGVVQEFAWLDERQFLDAVAVAMITPGPVVITVGFIGYLVAGPAGAVVAALGTFLPCYLFTVIPAPHFRRLQQNRAVSAFAAGVTAAATGAIAGAVVVLGRRAVVDAATAMIALSALLASVRFKKVPEPVLLPRSSASCSSGSPETALASPAPAGTYSAPTAVELPEPGGECDDVPAPVVPAALRCFRPALRPGRRRRASRVRAPGSA